MHEKSALHNVIFFSTAQCRRQLNIRNPREILCKIRSLRDMHSRTRWNWYVRWNLIKYCRSVRMAGTPFAHHYVRIMVEFMFDFKTKRIAHRSHSLRIIFIMRAPVDINATVIFLLTKNWFFASWQAPGSYEKRLTHSGPVLLKISILTSCAYNLIIEQLNYFNS